VRFEGGKGGIQLYPNPVSGGSLNVHFATEPEGAATLRIFDTGGKLVYRGTLTQQHNQSSYGRLPAGMYFVEIRSDNEVWRERLVVQ
jgi:hypothetical protein